MLTIEELDTTFNELSDITDCVALINSPYDSDLESAFEAMEGFMRKAMSWNLDEAGEELLRVYLSHMSFHREIVAEIIAEARNLLMEDRRTYLKRLVNYHKGFVSWFSRIEKRFAA